MSDKQATREQRKYITGQLNELRWRGYVREEDAPTNVKKARQLIASWSKKETAAVDKINIRLRVLRDKVRYELNFGSVSSCLSALDALKQAVKEQE